MIKCGIDVSKHNGEIDWEKAKATGQIDFAILRAGYGKIASQKDPQFERNYAECKRLGIPVGAYWYSYALTPQEARLEANVFLQIIKGKQFEYPVYFDIEEEKQFTFGKERCSEMAKAFCETMENAGYFVGIYSSKSGLENYISNDVRTRYTVWVAHVGVKKTDYSGAYGIWQYSWKERVQGITGNNGNVDMDLCYLEFPATIKRLGLNGFEKAEQTETDNKKTEVKHSLKIFIDDKLIEDKDISGLLDD